MQVPSNLVVSKIRYPAVYICSAVTVWGAISACTAAVSSYGGLLACRFMLGFVEAVFFPGKSGIICHCHCRLSFKDDCSLVFKVHSTTSPCFTTESKSPSEPLSSIPAVSWGMHLVPFSPLELRSWTAIMALRAGDGCKSQNESHASPFWDHTDRNTLAS